MMKNALIGALLILLAVTGYRAFARPDANDAPTLQALDADMCAEHQIAEKDCPWCRPSLIQEMGQCPGHGVPEALCSRCQPALIPGFKAENDWCAEHDLPESQCSLCHPDLLSTGGANDDAPTLQALDADMCAEHQIAEKDCPWCRPSLIQEMGQCPGHGVPKALCSRCQPALIPGFKAENDWCAEHDLPESQCTLCHPDLLSAGDTDTRTGSPSTSIQIISAPEVLRTDRPPSVFCGTEMLRVKFLSADIARNAGLEYAPVERREVTETLHCNAEIAYDGSRYAQLASRAPGVVREVKQDLGQRVEAGDILAIVDSADLGTAKAEYLQARAMVSLWERNHTRERDLLGRHVATERDVLEAETKLAESRFALSRTTQRLRNLGLSDSAIQEVATSEDTSSLLPMLAPFAGVVVERTAALGEVVDTNTALFGIADTSRMWAILDVYEADMARLRLDLPVVIDMDGLRGTRHGGRITWLSSHVERRTRTLKVRAEIANGDGLLRAGMFGKAIIRVRDGSPALVVPKTAVQWEGCCNVVFTRTSEMLFEPRKVWLGYETDRYFVAEAGIQEGEVVVTTGSFLLKTEIMKGSIGAGCCEVDPGKTRAPLDRT